MSSPPKARSPAPKERPEVPAKNVEAESTTEEVPVPGSEAGDDSKAEPPKTEEKAPAAADAPPLPGEPVPDGPPLPNEPTPDGPPLPNEPVPEPKDDGWDCQWDPTHQAWYFVNRFTGKTQWDNPRVASNNATATSSASTGPQPPTLDKSAVGGYNPAIHGDYDPNAWYAKGSDDEAEASPSAAGLNDQASLYASTAAFNRFTGQFQADDVGPGRHTDEAKSRRQMNAYFDVDAAANSHDGRSLKAERAGKKPSKAEVKAFKEKRRARKEEKRRAWLRD